MKKFSQAEEELMKKYRNLPNLGIHGMRKDWYESNNGDGLKNPNGSVFYHVIIDEEKALEPKEFVHRFRRSILQSIEFYLSDMTPDALENFYRGDFLYRKDYNLDQLPILLYLKDCFEGNNADELFSLSKENTGSNYNKDHPLIETGNPFNQGASYFNIPRKAIAETVELEAEDFEKIRQEIGKMSISYYGQSMSQKIDTAFKLIFYYKALKILKKFYNN